MRLAAVPIELEPITLGNGRSIAFSDSAKPFTARILSVQSGKISLSLNGTSVWARTGSVYDVGDVLHGITTRRANGTLLLQVLRRERAHPLLERFVQEAGLSRSPGTLGIAAALIRSGRPLDGAVVRRTVKRFQSHLKDNSNETARAAVEAEERGFAGDTEQALSLWWGGSDDGSTGQRFAKNRAREDSGPAIDDVRTYLLRTVKTPDHPLQLYNCLKTSAEVHWVVIPVQLSRNGRTLDGVVRVGISPLTGTAQVIALSARHSGGTVWIRISLPQRRIHLNLEGVNKIRAREFESKLETLFQQYDNITTTTDHDGADPAGRTENTYGVDRFG